MDLNFCFVTLTHQVLSFLVLKKKVILVCQTFVTCTSCAQGSPCDTTAYRCFSLNHGLWVLIRKRLSGSYTCTSPLLESDLVFNMHSINPWATDMIYLSKNGETVSPMSCRCCCVHKHKTQKGCREKGQRLLAFVQRIGWEYLGCKR